MRDYPTLNIEANYSKGLEEAIHHYTQIQIKVRERMQNVQKTIRSQLNVLITTYVNSCPNCQHFEEKRQYEVHAHVYKHILKIIYMNISSAISKGDYINTDQFHIHKM